MIRKRLAWLGLILILASIFLGTAWAEWRAPRWAFLENGETVLWNFVTSYVSRTPGQALALSAAGLLVGLLLIVPWWRRRLAQESVWWEKREQPLDTPPRVP